MSAADTRLLVLGVVRLFGPANGYQLRRELLSWEVDRWANVKPGSIYSMLSTLAAAGSIERHDLAGEDGGRTVAVYTITEAGEREFGAALREAIAVPPDSGDLLSFRVALSFAPALERSEFLEALRARRDALSGGLVDADEKATLALMASIPPHVAWELELEQRLLRTQLEWVEQAIASVEAGGLRFAGEGHDGWMPPEDDPGWRMEEERRDYLARLGVEDPRRRNSSSF